MTFTDEIQYDIDIHDGDRFPNRIETDRLILRGPIDDHVTLGELCAFHEGDAGRRMADPNDFEAIETVEDAAGVYDYVKTNWREGDAAYYAVYEKERSADYPHEFCGIADIEFNWEYRSAEIGVWLHPAVWGNQYASERAEALLAVIFDSPVGAGISVVNVTPKASNEKSIRSVEKYVSELGGRRVGTVENFHVFAGDDAPADAVIFQISREEFDR